MPKSACAASACWTSIARPANSTARTRDQLIGDLNRICDDAAYEVICEEMGALADTNSTYRTEFDTQTLSGEKRTVTMIVSIEPSPGTGRA